MARRTASESPPDPRLPVTALAPAALEALIRALGFEPYRAGQILHALLAGRARTWNEIPGLPRALRDALADRLPLIGTRLLGALAGADGTVKLAVGLGDAQVIECALIPAGNRLTLCLSTQAGCPVGCAFCASGIGGLVRDLEAWEMLEQALHAKTLHPARRITHLVVMGVGEPLFNLSNLLTVLERLQDPGCLGLGARRMVVSTSGIVPGMDALAERTPPVALAVSLHAADQGVRERLVPAARLHRVEAIAEAAGRYQERTGRQVTFEVVLLEGLNDSPRHATALVRLLGGRGFHVNLIPVNPVPGLPFRPPPQARVRAFADLLRRAGLSATVRRPRGLGEAAACGQLRRSQGPPG